MRKSNGKKTGICFKDSPTLTEQHHKESVSIQTIVQQHAVTGMLPLNRSQPQFADMSNVPDYHQAQIIIAETNEMFEAVPSDIRKDFDNDPAKFLAFIENPDNKEQIEAYGLDSTHIPADYVKPPTPEQQQQVHIEELIASKMAETTPLSSATPEQLRNALASHEAT